MSVHRSPLRGKPLVERTLNYPRGRLAAVTRKKNEILNEIQNSDPNLTLVTECFEEFKEKVKTFEDECLYFFRSKEITDEEMEEFKNWHQNHTKEINSFVSEIDTWLTTNDVSPDDSVSQVKSLGKLTNASKGSQSSRISLKIRLAEKRAQRLAEEFVCKKKRELEDQQRNIERQKEDLELQKSLIEEQNLQEEIENLELSHSRVSIRRTLLDNTEHCKENPNHNYESKTRTLNEMSRNDNFLPKNECAPLINNTDGLTHILKRQNEISVMLLRNQEKANLPSHTPDNFDGNDITQYKSFIQSFERLIENKCDNDIDRLYYLEKYTSGLPLQLVKGCRVDDPSIGYREARKLLQKEFGDEYLVAQAYIEKLNRWHPIKHEDGKALRELSIYILSCNNMMQDVSALNQLNSPVEIMKVVNKLPYKLKDRWRHHTLNLREQNKSILFSDFCKFIRRESDLINQPLFGDISDHRDSKNDTGKLNANYRKKIFATSMENTSGPFSKPCLVCKKENHQMRRCFFFQKRSYDEKMNFIRENKICFGCLKSTEHVYKDCKDKEKCEVCGKPHPTILHSEKRENEQKDKDGKKDRKKEVDTKLENSFNFESQFVGQENKEAVSGNEKVSCATKSLKTSQQSGAGKRVICPSLPVKVRVLGTNKMVTTYMGLDPFCNDVFMSNKLLTELGLEGRECNVNLTTMQEKQAQTTMRVINNLEVYDLDENERSLIPTVFSKNESWPFDKDDVLTPKDLESYQCFQDIPFRYIDAEIGLLVGLNQPHIMKVKRTIDGPVENGPYVTEHKHGFALNGPINSYGRSIHRCFRIKIEKTSEIDHLYKELVAKEFADENTGDLQPSVQDQIWERKVRSSLRKLPNGHFEVGLPFKENYSTFPINREQVLKRLMSSKKRLHEDKLFYDEYNEFMNDMLLNKFAEEIPQAEIQGTPGHVWYLAHFGVFHKQKNKLRIVFDASLKYKNVSLNDMLLQGPDLTNNLLGVLLRYRQENIAFMADIRKMFYQVEVPRHQRDYLRFLWFPNGDLTQPPAEYRVTVHIFGAISSPSIANFVLRELTQSKETEHFSKRAKESIMRNFYVDDLMKSTCTQKDAKHLLHEIRDLISTGGFKLKDVASNSREVLSSVPEDDLSKNLINLDISGEDLPYEKALGVMWNVEADTIGFKLKLPITKGTRRGVLSTVFSIYDPFGIASPVILPAKRIFQKTCYEGLQWDEELPPDLKESWTKWLADIHLISNYTIPRYMRPSNNVTITQLHIFADGSEAAFAAVAYLRCMDEHRHVNCSLVMSKTRLVPHKNGSVIMTIPRIELNAAKLAVQIKNILDNELEITIDDTFFWSDSTTVLKYLKNESRCFQRFVSNRVAYIRTHTNIENWRFVPGDLNPADIASRGVSTSKFVENKLWKTGPDYLLKPQTEWPEIQINNGIHDDDKELKKEKRILTTTIEETPTDRLIQSASTWFKTLKRIAWVLRLKKCLHMKSCIKGELQPEEMREAKLAICKYLQEKEFSSTLSQMRSQDQLKKTNSLVKLNPFLDDKDILRVGGRITRSMTSYETRHPIILPQKHHTVLLLVRHIHGKMGHLGREVILSELRKKYWILGANSLARKVTRECLACRKRQSKPMEQIMGDLPTERLSFDIPVFTHTGLDCFGPFYVIRSRSKVKRYGVIFTCLSSRAIHIEIVFTLESDSFISALRRFSIRRGLPKTIRSDNGTNFVGAQRELKLSIDSYNSKKMKEWLLQNEIIWKFQPPTASHFGGVWEREIRTIRKVLNALTNEQPMHLDDEGLSTLMCEVEGILNSRPLTAISNDPNDIEALTPNHLLLSRSEVTFPPGLFTKDDHYVRRRWRQIQYLAELFWCRWRKEYLPLLQERQKWQREVPPCKENDLVLLVDQQLPRNQWSLGRIQKTYPDNKGNVRVVDVKISKIKGELKPGMQTVTIQRPISKLISLTCNDL